MRLLGVHRLIMRLLLLKIAVTALLVSLVNDLVCVRSLMVNLWQIISPNLLSRMRRQLLRRLCPLRCRPMSHRRNVVADPRRWLLKPLSRRTKQRQRLLMRVPRISPSRRNNMSLCRRESRSISRSTNTNIPSEVVVAEPRWRLVLTPSLHLSPPMLSGMQR